MQSTRKPVFAVRRHHPISYLFALFIVLALLLAACSASLSGTGSSGNGNRSGPTSAFTPTPTPTPFPPTASLSVYASSQPGPGSAGGVVSALSASDGSLRWRYQTSVISLSLIEDNGVIYVVGSEAQGAGSIVYALRSSNGSVIWKQAVNSYGLIAPQIIDGVLYTASLLDGTVYALHINDGSMMWHTKTTHTNGVAFMLVSGTQVYVTGVNDGAIYALRASDGALQWKYASGKQNLAPPQTDGNNVYVLAANSPMDPETLLALRSSNGSLHWHYQQGNNFVSLPVLANGNVYVDVSDGNVYALRGTDGSTLWQSAVGRAGSSSTPTAANGTIYVANPSDKNL